MADAVAPTQGEATPSTNTNPAESAAAQTSAPAAAPSEPIFSNEEAIEIKKFLDNNGGFEKVKQNITARQNDKTTEPAKAQDAPAQPVAQTSTDNPQPSAPANEPQAPAKGFLTPAEIAAQMYNERLESVPEYEGIKEYIHNGEYLKEMRKMGMQPIDLQGNVNDTVIRQWLDLKAKTVPAKPTEAAMTNTPIKTFTQVEGDIKDMETAQKIYMEGSGNPRYNDAKAFVEKSLGWAAPTQPQQPATAQNAGQPQQ